MLNKLWSPQQISARLRFENPDDPELRVSHETIYQSLFVQSRGTLRKELSACLRSKRTRRRPHGRKDPGGYIKDMVLISDRPAEIEDRAIPGHWEGDLILGARGQSAIATLVEPQTRYVMLVAVTSIETWLSYPYLPVVLKTQLEPPLLDCSLDERKKLLSDLSATFVPRLRASSGHPQAGARALVGAM